MIGVVGSALRDRRMQYVNLTTQGKKVVDQKIVSI